MRIKHSLQETGDTIVEVLISIAVVGGLLVISYATMNRSMLTVRANQERAEATRIAQEQIEAIARIQADTADGQDLRDNSQIEAGQVAFCITADGVRERALPHSNVQEDNFDAGEGGPYEHCHRGYYNYAATRIAENTYRVIVRWERIGGGPRNELVMAYRTTAR